MLCGFLKPNKRVYLIIYTIIQRVYLMIYTLIQLNKRVYCINFQLIQSFILSNGVCLMPVIQLNKPK